MDSDDSRSCQRDTRQSRRHHGSEVIWLHPFVWRVLCLVIPDAPLGISFSLMGHHPIAKLIPIWYSLGVMKNTSLDLPGVNSPVSSALIKSIGRRLRSVNRLVEQLAGVSKVRKARKVAITPVAPAPEVPPAEIVKAKKVRQLTEIERTDITLLLTKTKVPVAVIAKLYSVTRPTIYNLRDKLGLNTRRGSEALIRGVHRAQSRGSVPVAPIPATPAPVEQVAMV